MDYKLEVVVLPVSDVDKARDFYTGLGWRLDADYTSGDFRVVQVSSPTSTRPGPSWPASAPTSARSSTTPAACSTTPGPRGGSAARRRITRVTARSSRSTTRTATTGTCRKSPPGCRAANRVTRAAQFRRTGEIHGNEF
jgi:hypothetical protein